MSTWLTGWIGGIRINAVYEYKSLGEKSGKLRELLGMCCNAGGLVFRCR